MKIIDKIKEKSRKNEIFYSFEYFPPRKDSGMGELISIISQMSNINPLWVDITWGAGGRQSSSTLLLASYIQNYLNLDVLMHLTVRCQSKESIDKALDEAKKNGIVNILALRGDPPITEEYNDYNTKNDYFQYAEDLIKYIKTKYNDYFCIIVAGYPNMHFDSKDKQEDLMYLKRKVEAGADAIISQLFFNEEDFLCFERECKEFGISVPIIPGVYTINSYQSLRRMSELCKVEIPTRFLSDLDEIKNDKEKVKSWGLNEGIRLCRELVKRGVLGLHFYTMNIAEVSIEIIKRLGIENEYKQDKSFPWTRSIKPNRFIEESIRPVFWLNNTKSYIGKTYYFTEYPSKIQDFEKINRFQGENHFETHYKPIINEEESQKNQKSSKIECKIEGIFLKYFSLEIDYLPWFDNNSIRTKVNNDFHFKEILASLLKKSIFIVNFLPSINCLPSNDFIHGWGGEDGFIYQKYYIEFFMNRSDLHSLIEKLGNERSIVYKASNLNGEVYKSFDKEVIISLTWGVFSDFHVKQPIIYQSELFSMWKEEAFQKWNAFFNIFHTNPTVIKSLNEFINSNYFLVSLIDNDYVNPRVVNVLKDYINT